MEKDSHGVDPPAAQLFRYAGSCVRRAFWVMVRRSKWVGCNGVQVLSSERIANLTNPGHAVRASPNGRGYASVN
jgi:hypothetical protein